MIWLPLERNSGIPLFRQIYVQIRDLILEGKIRGGERLPSTRELAVELGVSRNVVVEAYEQLLAEGYVTGKQGSGTRVADGTYFREYRKQPKSLLPCSPKPQPQMKLIDFRSGVPALDCFPLQRWGRLLHQVCSERSGTLLNYNEPAGRIELRRVLCEYLLRVRGIRCMPDQVMITSGATQGLALAGRLFFAPGAKAIVEDPLNYGMQMVFSQAGYQLMPVPVDEFGIRTDQIPRDQQAKFIYVTPSHQYPLGGILPAQRRIELIRMAGELGCYIVEDDYDSEFRYGGPALSALQMLNPDQVIYVGSFSKILAPALRLGYMVLPISLVNESYRIKKYFDVHTPVLEQLALARFIGEGRLARYILNLRKIYGLRRQTLIEELERNFPGKHRIGGAATGLHLTVEFPGVEFSSELLQQIHQAGVRVYPVEKHAIRKGNYLGRVIMGYGHLGAEEIKEGVFRLKSILDT